MVDGTNEVSFRVLNAPTDRNYGEGMDNCFSPGVEFDRQFGMGC
jgi:hypothetical protein